MPATTRLARALAAATLAFVARTDVRAQATAPSAQATGSACASAPGTASTVNPLAPGEYTLTLVATGGSEAGARTTGVLRLRPTTRDDRSPRTGKTAAPPGAIATPLYGTADLDWRAVGAPMAGVVDPGDTLHPVSTSDDPVYPGVLVLARGTDIVLSIGSLFNRRDGGHWLDGAGIGLRVGRIDDRGFSGTWKEFGIMRNGSGYFCAVRR